MESYLGKKNCNSNAQFKYFEAEDIPDILMHSISGQNTIKNRPISRNKSLEDLKKPGLKFNMLPENNVLSSYAKYLYILQFDFYLAFCKH